MPRPTRGSRARSRTDAAAAIVDALHAVVRELRLASREAEQRVGLHPAQLHALHRLGLGPASSLTELAERTHTDISSVSVVVSRLVEQGLVVRRSGNHDRRRHALELTARGRAVVRRTPETETALVLQAARRLSDREVRALAATLGKLVNGLNNASESG